MNEPRRIAFCITSLGPGGAERCLANLVTRLPPERFHCEVHVLQERPEHDWFVRQIEAAQTPVKFYNTRRKSDGLRLVRELASAWRKSEPQVVQSMMFHANCATALARKLAGSPMQVSGIRAAERTAPHRIRLERLLLASAVRHVCVSEAVAKYTASVGRLPRRKLVVIPNGVDITKFRNAQPSGGPPFRPITFIGRIDEQKNVIALIQHAALFLDRLPGHGLQVVGDGPLIDLAVQAARPFGARIQFMKPTADVARVLAASELLVLCSRWEGMPNVVLEAMAAGRPVVATEVEGVRELLGPAGEQQIVPVDDMTALADRIVTTVDDSELARQLGAANALRAEQEFSLETMVERYARLYESLLVDAEC